MRKQTLCRSAERMRVPFPPARMMENLGTRPLISPPPIRGKAEPTAPHLGLQLALYLVRLEMSAESRGLSGLRLLSVENDL